MSVLVAFLCHSLDHVNQSTIKVLRAGEHLETVRRNVNMLLVPVLHLLQQRVCREQQQLSEDATPSVAGGNAARALEDARGQWCSLLGEPDLAPEVGDLLQLILEPPAPKDLDAKSRNCDHISQKDDLALADRYDEATQRLKRTS